MKIRRNPARKARIEIIPMIDTMFFLLVFFMLASLSMTVQRGLPVDLPRAASARDEVRDTLTLTLTRDHNLYLDKRKLASPAEAALCLQQRIQTGRSLSVIINADQGVKHGRVVELMDAVRQGGVHRMAIAVIPQETSSF
jgi:biopolymer transport protein ExbD